MLVVTDSPMIQAFRIPENLDYIKLPHRGPRRRQEEHRPDTAARHGHGAGFLRARFSAWLRIRTTPSSVLVAHLAHRRRCRLNGSCAPLRGALSAGLRYLTIARAIAPGATVGVMLHHAAMSAGDRRMLSDLLHVLTESNARRAPHARHRDRIARFSRNPIMRILMLLVLLLAVRERGVGPGRDRAGHGRRRTQAVLPGATIVLASDVANPRETTSDGSGRFVFARVAPGSTGCASCSRALKRRTSN